MIPRIRQASQLHDDVAVLYLELGRAGKRRHISKRRSAAAPSAAAHFNLGTALTMAGKLDEAIDHYQRALRSARLRARAQQPRERALAARDIPTKRSSISRRAPARPGECRSALQRGKRAGFARRAREAAVSFARPSSSSRTRPALASLAWLLATAPEAALRDADQAIRLAERAAELTGRRDASALDVLAAAYAAAGQFDRAVDTAQRRSSSSRTPPSPRRFVSARSYTGSARPTVRGGPGLVG